MSTADALRSAGGTPGKSGRTKCWQPTAGEIDGLVGELHNLQERLVIDVNRIQDDITQYAALGRAVARLIQISAEGMARVTGADFAEAR